MTWKTEVPASSILELITCDPPPKILHELQLKSHSPSPLLPAKEWWRDETIGGQL